MLASLFPVFPHGLAGWKYEKASEEQWDELDFYMDLLEIGITVDMVRKYMSDNHADIMEKFCEEHGLE